MIPKQVWAVVVARTGPTAKSRLRQVLSPAERSAIAQRMLSAVLHACAAADLGGSVVVTDDVRGARIAQAAGALFLPDPGAGLNAAVALGLDAVAQQPPGSAALVLPGDVPLVEPEDLLRIIAAATDEPRVVVAVPDANGRGTNALLIRPPQLIAPSFGEPSIERHLALARRRGTAIRLELPRLSRDIDDPAHLDAWSQAASSVTG
jgi:2-phospho-L-lactate guanylyltransferase